jgi:Fur family zinc uptake transcriptional regulator
MKISKCCNKNDQQALNVLKKHSKGLTAYSLLSELQKNRNIKPMTIYRSLKNLQKMGVVHKSNQSKTYFVCNSSAKDKHNPAVAVCKKCEKTEELNPNIFSKLFNNIKTKEKYNFSNFEIEISTICQKCN